MRGVGRTAREVVRKFEHPCGHGLSPTIMAGDTESRRAAANIWLLDANGRSERAPTQTRSTNPGDLLAQRQWIAYASTIQTIRVYSIRSDLWASRLTHHLASGPTVAPT